MSKRLLFLSLGFLFFLSGMTVAQRPGVIQAVNPFGSGITLSPGFDFASISPTVGGDALNVTSLTLTSRGSNTLLTSSFQLFDASAAWGGNNNVSLSLDSSMGTLAFPAVAPAAPPNLIPGEVGTLTAVGDQYQLQAAQPNGPGLAVSRPDFNYVAPRLEFERITSSRTGQKDLDLAPATARRFIPVGEF